VDSREHYGTYVVDKFIKAGIDAEIATLPQSSGADYVIANTYGSCALQRKDSMAEICGTPVSDKYKSAMEELLLGILPRLISFTNNPILLVEESHVIGEQGYLFRRKDNHWVETGMHCTSYYGFLETVRMMGVDVVCTRNLDASIWYLISMHGYLGKCHYPRHKKMFTSGQRAVGMLCCAPGVGERAAAQVLANYSIQELLEVDESKLKALKSAQLASIKKITGWKSS